MTITVEELKELLSKYDDKVALEKLRTKDEHDLKVLAVESCHELKQENKVLHSVLTWKQKKKLNLPI